MAFAWAAGVTGAGEPASAARNATRAENAWHTATLGWCEDYPEETRTIANAREDLVAARDSGAKVLRIAFGWDSIEEKPGAYDWSFWDDYVRIATRELGLTLIPYVCYTPKWAATDPGKNFWRSPPRRPDDFARFMGAIVRHYRDSIHSWELWNEPDNEAYWLGTPQQFAALIRAGSKAVRLADPKATIVLGGIAGRINFLETLFRDEHLAPFVDVVNIHSYLETWHSDPIETLPRYVADAERVVEAYGEHEPLWMAEVGYSTVGERAEVSGSYRERFRGEHTDAAQAAAEARILVLALATGELPLIAWYRINDLPSGEQVIGDDNNRHLGLRAQNGAAKPALGTFARFARWFAQPFRVLPTTVKVERTQGEAHPEVRSFALQDGRTLVAAWLAMPGSAAKGAMPVPDPRGAVVSVTCDGVRGRNVRIANAQDRPLAAGDARCVLRSDAADFTLTLRAGEVVLAMVGPERLTP